MEYINVDVVETTIYQDIIDGLKEKKRDLGSLSLGVSAYYDFPGG